MLQSKLPQLMSSMSAVPLADGESDEENIMVSTMAEEEVEETTTTTAPSPPTNAGAPASVNRYSYRAAIYSNGGDASGGIGWYPVVRGNRSLAAYECNARTPSLYKLVTTMIIDSYLNINYTKSFVDLSAAWTVVDSLVEMRTVLSCGLKFETQHIDWSIAPSPKFDLKQNFAMRLCLFWWWGFCRETIFLFVIHVWVMICKSSSFCYSRSSGSRSDLLGDISKLYSIVPERAVADPHHHFGGGNFKIFVTNEIFLITQRKFFENFPIWRHFLKFSTLMTLSQAKNALFSSFFYFGGIPSPGSAAGTH